MPEVNVDYDMLMFAITDVEEDRHLREILIQEMDEYFSFNRTYQELTSAAKNALSRYEMIKKGEEYEY